MNYCLDARTATDHFPGIGRYVSNLARSIVEQLHPGEALTLILDPTAPSRWPMPSERSGPVTTLEAPVSPFGLRQQVLIPRHLRSLQSSVYHSPYYLMPYQPGVPTVLTVYDLIPRHFPQYVSGRARLLFRLTTRLALRAAAQVITISEASRTDVLHVYGLAAERVTAVPLAPAPRFSPQPKREIDRVRKKYDLSEYVLYLGINKPHKNLVRLLEAWKRIRTDAVLVIAGVWDGRYPEPKVRAAELAMEQRVRFRGPVADEDLPGIYAGARLFVFPSLYEGFGLPVIEAMASGTAVACSNTSSLPEVVGDAAALFNPRDVGDMADVVAQALDSERQRSDMQARGLAQARKYTWPRTAQATLAIYRRMARSDRR